MSDTMTTEEALAKLAELNEQLNQLKNVKEETVEQSTNKVKKNQKPGKPSAGTKYVLLSKSLSSWGKVPQQQADIAKLLGEGLEVDREYTEAEVFNLVAEKCAAYPSLANSRQDPTYLFRYYRGLKNDGKHAGFIARNFLQVK